MSEAWRGLDLEGGGLHAENIRLAQALRRRSRAHGLLAAFPLGRLRTSLGAPARTPRTPPFAKRREAP